MTSSEQVDPRRPDTPRRPRRLWLPLAAFAVGLAALGLAALLTLLAPQRETGVAAIGGPFRLTDHSGEAVTNDSLKGCPFAVFFGFTHCPDVCPTTMWEMSELLAALGDAPGASELRVYFVTVDPERDTRELLRSYIQSFDERIVGLTGSPDEIAAVAKAFRAYYAKVPTADGRYTLNHTATVYLMGRDGHFVSALAYQEPRDAALAKLRRLIAVGRST